MPPEVVILVSSTHWQCVPCKHSSRRDVSLDLHLHQSHPVDLDHDQAHPSDLESSEHDLVNSKRRIRVENEAVLSPNSVGSSKHVQDDDDESEFAQHGFDEEVSDSNAAYHDRDSDSDFVPPVQKKKKAYAGGKSKRRAKSAKWKSLPVAKGTRKSESARQPSSESKSLKASPELGSPTLPAEQKTMAVKLEEEENNGRTELQDSEQNLEEVSVSATASEAVTQRRLKTRHRRDEDEDDEDEEDNDHDSSTTEEVKLENDEDFGGVGSDGDTDSQAEQNVRRSSRQSGRTFPRLRARDRSTPHKRSRYSPELNPPRPKKQAANIQRGCSEPKKRGRPLKPKPDPKDEGKEDEEEEPATKRAYRYLCRVFFFLSFA